MLFAIKLREASKLTSKVGIKLVLNWYYFCNDSVSYVIIARAFSALYIFQICQ